MGQQFDCVVVGAGMVGAATALGLARQGRSVALVEPAMPETFRASQLPDLRVSAISAASQRLLEELGAWQAIADMRLQPYRRLAVWEEPQARTEFNAVDINRNHLGHIIENRVVQLGLHQALSDYTNVTWFDAGFAELSMGPGQAAVSLNNGELLTAKLVIGADGAQSRVRQAAGIGTTGWQYRQHALAITVKTQDLAQDITWQQFFPSGPRAFLPLFDGYASLVWYDAPETVQRLEQLSHAQLKQAIMETFPDELVDFEVTDKASFPLTRMHAQHYFSGRTVILGDAAHTINPLAGQGVNLGFKDVGTLLSVVDSIELSEADALEKSLRQFAHKRRPDNLLMMTAMDSFYKTFSNDLALMKALRNAALTLAERSGPIKNQVMRYAMGL
ncbi:2-octaprenyl-3-methyl-6-methoxy-1,4-benzoquinol hydroxylase [Saliniradius amylolyticus]|uniref:2-octaprenyl-3-methyl-6-methoxy-1,4-benzoquinol hydroxylase n=1 Tax=Saliniradius amylolyticus TaxID=2183582 RepID=A0A2S2E2J9_9ALTE|nr:FAD-dependent oxidoreductase [Saliniradius amylolyticus]AWL11490.1 2-octaprenyl-3-methyl-6-methoxy-1,4-benzoquinol hydroxylase [Saliniradius amylolyticus]